MKVILLIDSSIYDNTYDAANMGITIPAFECSIASENSCDVENWTLSCEPDVDDDQEDQTVTVATLFNKHFDALAFFGVKHKMQIIVASADDIICQLAEGHGYHASLLKLPGKIDPDTKTKAIDQLRTAGKHSRFFVDIDDTLVHLENSYAEEKIIYNKDIVEFCQYVQKTFPKTNMQVLTARNSLEFTLLLELLKLCQEKDESIINQGDLLASLEKFDTHQNKWSIKIFLEDFSLDIQYINSQLSQEEIDEVVKALYETDHFFFAENIIQGLAQEYALTLDLNIRSYTNGQCKGSHIKKYFSDRPVVFLIDDNIEQLKGFNELTKPFFPLGVKVYTMQDFNNSLNEALASIALTIRAIKATTESTIFFNQRDIADAQTLVACHRKALEDLDRETVTIDLKDFKAATTLMNYSGALIFPRKRKSHHEDQAYETDHEDKRHCDARGIALKPT
ncbi:MAG: hypothetical protein K0S08_1583 [Gammaproteobacteria bacterium]|jgi:hypothetical protein|nr:hypothetical protein [Gammaproteobacteria bacterium]